MTYIVEVASTLEVLVPRKYCVGAPRITRSSTDSELIFLKIKIEQQVSAVFALSTHVSLGSTAVSATGALHSWSRVSLQFPPSPPCGLYFADGKSPWWSEKCSFDPL